MNPNSDEDAYDVFFNKLGDISQEVWKLVLVREHTGSSMTLSIVHPGNEEYFCQMVDVIVDSCPEFELHSIWREKN